MKALNSSLDMHENMLLVPYENSNCAWCQTAPKLKRLAPAYSAYTFFDFEAVFGPFRVEIGQICLSNAIFCLDNLEQVIYVSIQLQEAKEEN